MIFEKSLENVYKNKKASRFSIKKKGKPFIGKPCVY